MNLDSKYFDRLRTKRKRPTTTRAEQEAANPVCQWDGCNKPGKHRAPVGRNAEGQFFLFCFEHVKEYNKGYNYFDGLSDSEIARYQKEALTGHRPTWTVGVNGDTRRAPLNGSKKAGNAASFSRMRDPFGFVNDGEGARPQRPKRERKLKTLEARAFDTLGLTASATSDDIKKQYKALVKKHHPDTNGGDRGSEEIFRAVVQAYQLLKQSGFC
ncbi:J domain-containing protein [Martelella endophytica]|uniref:Molecular chaperone DnaJ n=1 Tax=Martelella endophytica TaxID=1486262 RepID=A0A0D5LS70_MAREN|nr:J domain-containing protein [Martelella endophytica]AJY46218.1 molecular chaperone DnaJ [Martelella endophytica]